MYNLRIHTTSTDQQGCTIVTSLGCNMIWTEVMHGKEDGKIVSIRKYSVRIGHFITDSSRLPLALQ